MSTVMEPKCGVCGAEFDRAYTPEEADALKVMSSVPPVQLIEGNFSRVRVRAQDVVVVASPHQLSEKDKADIQSVIRTMFPGNKLLILDEGIAIGALAPVRDEDCDEDEDDGA